MLYFTMQNGESNVVIDNIHSIIAAAAVKFNSQQLEHLFIHVHKVMFVLFSSQFK